MSQPTFKFPANGSPLKILQLADTQPSTFNSQGCSALTLEQSRYPCNAYNTTDFIARLLDGEDPDLVVYTGDNLTGNQSPASGEEVLRNVFAPVVAGGYPFTAVHGNHDEEGSWTRDAYMNFTLSQPGAIGTLATDGVKGVNNHVIQIEASNSTETAFNIWMFDSGDYSRVGGISGYDWIYLNQIQWYQNTATSIQQESGRSVPQDSMAFFHIPTPEWWDASEGPIVGDMFEGVYAPNINSGLMTEMRTMGGVRVASVGHDHVNDWCGTWYGIHLCYGGGIGYTTYGRTGWPRRARVFEVYEDGRIVSWKRLDDDNFSKIDEQDLSEGRPEEEYCDYTAPSQCANGCAIWDDLASDYNTRSQSAVDAKWYDGVGPSNRCCARPAYDRDSSPWCYCRGSADQSAGSSWNYCSASSSRQSIPSGSIGVPHFVEGDPCDFPLKPGASEPPAHCLEKN